MRSDRGDGTIYQRKSDGRWVGVLDLGGDTNGHRQRRVFYATATKEKEARAELKVTLENARVAKRAGTLPPAGSATVEQWTRHWLDEVVATSVRANTLRNYEKVMRIHVIPALGGTRLDRLTPDQVRLMLNDRQRAGLAPGSVRQIRTVLRICINQAIKDRRLTYNVVSATLPPKVEEYEVEPLSPAEVRAFVDALKGHRLEHLLVVALGTGLRQGEVLGLRWSDVDLDAGKLWVRQSVQRQKGKGVVATPTKTKKSARRATLPPTVLAALRARKPAQAWERRIAGSLWRGDSDLIFTSRTGMPLDGTHVTREFQEILYRAGMRQLRFHDLRHSAATLWLLEGVEPRVIMELLGHTTLAMTSRYSHVVDKMRDDAAKAMERVLSGQ